jgi:hypothetical protein
LKNLVCIFVLAIIIAFSAAAAENPVIIDGNFSDWDNIPYLANFSWNYNPVYFTRELNGNVANYTIENAYFWKKDGSHIHGIKAFVDSGILYVYVENHSNYSENFSIYMYIYPEREEKQENSFTLEIIPATEFEISQNQDKGGIVLWEKGQEKPVQIGTLRNSYYNMEFSIPVSELPSSLKRSISSVDKLSVDVTTCVSEPDTGMFEEFFFTAIYARDVPKSEEL